MSRQNGRMQNEEDSDSDENEAEDLLRTGSSTDTAPFSMENEADFSLDFE